MAVSKKMETVPSLLEFNKILERISYADTIGHLFIVDIKFHNKNSKPCFLTKHTLPFLKKNKKVNAHERSAVHLMSTLSRNNKRNITNSFKCTEKTHSTLGDKKFIPLYAKHLHFLIECVGWLVTRIDEHFTFEQSKLKKIKKLGERERLLLRATSKNV